MPEVVVLAGPTAVGKTALSLHLARALNAEIVSADSRQIYREMTIGTAKPTADELSSVPHHFIDERSVDESYSAGRFGVEAEQRIQSILDRGRRVIVAGGSTLYLKALLEGLAEIPPIPPGVRESLTARLENEGAMRLYEQLRRHDPTYAATLDPTKTQRLIRGLEVLEATGKPLSFYHRTGRRPAPSWTYRPLVLTRPRPALYDRINRRVDQMLHDGLIHEVEGILEAGYTPTMNPLRTIGYKEIILYLSGSITLEKAFYLIKRNTRRYAKRQLTWFRNQYNFKWVDLSLYSDVSEAIQAII